VGLIYYKGLIKRYLKVKRNLINDFLIMYMYALFIYIYGEEKYQFNDIYILIFILIESIILLSIYCII
jgi:hypothetical protein